MTTIQLEKLKKYLILQVLFGTNASIVAKLPNAQEYLKELDAAILEIQTYKKLQQEGNKELTEQEKQLKAKLIAELLETQRRLQAYATRMKDNLLLETTNLSKTDMNRMDELDLIAYAKMIYSKVDGLLVNIEQYGLNATTQKTLMDITTQFEALNPESGKSEVDKKSTTSYLAEAYKKADRVLSDMDKEVEIIRSSEPKFYSEYKAIRKIDLPTDVMGLIAKITDAETGTGIPNATATFTLNGSTAEPIVKQSAEKGGFQIKTIAPGIYTLVITKIGYKTQTLTVTLPGDEPYDLAVKMVKG